MLREVKQNPVVLHWETANALDKICDTVRSDLRFTPIENIESCRAVETLPEGALEAEFSCSCTGRCNEIVMLAGKAVLEWKGTTRYASLLHVFNDELAIVEHVVERLMAETELMRTPSRRGTAMLCFRRAVGASYRELTITFGFPETTLESVFRQNKGFIDWMVEQIGDDYEEDCAKLWENLDANWTRWVEGSLLEESEDVAD